MNVITGPDSYCQLGLNQAARQPSRLAWQLPWSPWPRVNVGVSHHPGSVLPPTWSFSPQRSRQILIAPVCKRASAFFFFFVMLSKRGPAILTSLFKASLFGSFVYLRPISQLFICLFFILLTLPFRSRVC